MNVRYVVTLTEAERNELQALVAKGSRLARRVKKAQILLAADSGANDDEVARLLVVGTSTVYRTKKRFVEEGVEAALRDRPRPRADCKLSVKDEALLVATACTKPPPGRARWTLELLTGELVRLTEHDTLSTETVRRRLHEKDIKPWQKRCGASRPSTGSTSPGWKTCSNSMARNRTHRFPSSASTRARHN